MKNTEARGAGLPAWLDGQTVAIISTLLTVAVSVATITLVSAAGVRTEIGGLREEMSREIGGLRTAMRAEIGSLRTEMKDMRKELNAQLNALDVRLRALEQTVTVIKHSVANLEARLLIVEAHTREPLETAHVGGQPDG